jgi:hypothetical protein
MAALAREPAGEGVRFATPDTLTDARCSMPWKIIKAVYDVEDPTTLHDDEMIAIERALRETMGEPQNEFNARWRAWKKARPLACECNGQGDPLDVLPPGAAGATVVPR